MKKSALKAVSLCLCGTLVIGCGGVHALASGNEASVRPVPVSAAAPVQAPPPSAKEETVYVLASADGTVEKVIVSDWLKNAGGSASLADNARLDGVENVKGSESFTLSGDTRVWDAQGNDIYTRGTTEQDLPVSMTVRYTLDGKAISPEELAGKSGRVAIRFDYDNHASTSWWTLTDSRKRSTSPSLSSPAWSWSRTSSATWRSPAAGSLTTGTARR